MKIKGWINECKYFSLSDQPKEKSTKVSFSGNSTAADGAVHGCGDRAGQAPSVCSAHSVDAHPQVPKV